MIKKYEVNKKVIDDDYSEKKAALTFERDMKEINGVLKTRVMMYSILSILML